MTLHHFIFNNDPYTDWLRVNAVGGLGGTTGTIIGYDRDRTRDLARHPALGGGGFTHHPYDHDPATSGFSVALHPDSGAVTHVHPAQRFSPGHIANHRQAAVDLLAHGWQGHKVFQGGWLDSDSKKVYLETAHVSKDEGEARHLAVAHRQKAYYDLGQGRTTFFDPLHDPAFRGEHGPAKQLDQIEHYASVGKRFGTVRPEGYDDYADQYEHEKPDAVKNLRFTGRQEYRKGQALGHGAAWARP